MKANRSTVHKTKVRSNHITRRATGFITRGLKRGLYGRAHLSYSSSRSSSISPSVRSTSRGRLSSHSPSPSLVVPIVKVIYRAATPTRRSYVSPTPSPSSSPFSNPFGFARGGTPYSSYSRSPSPNYTPKSGHSVYRRSHTPSVSSHSRSSSPFVRFR